MKQQFQISPASNQLKMIPDQLIIGSSHETQVQVFQFEHSSNYQLSSVFHIYENIIIYNIEFARWSNVLPMMSKISMQSKCHNTCYLG